MFTRDLQKKLGEILLEQGKISEEQLRKALSIQEKHKVFSKKIGVHFIDLGYTTESDIADALAAQFNLPLMPLEGIRIKPDVIDLIPETIIFRFNIVPLFRVGDELTVAVSDPTEISVLDILQAETRCRIVPVIATYSGISNLIARSYSRRIETHAAEKSPKGDITEINRSEVEELKRASGETSIVRVVDRILMEAVEDGSSDVHIEPRESNLSVRFRIDGVMQEYASYPLRSHPGLVSRIKILASLDISERQKPQDGKIRARIDDRDIDIRVSCLPTIYGEKVVMRLLDRSSVRVRIEDLAFSENNLEIFSRLIREAYGLILVTGPTGSGKTTTLYATLNEINSIEKNIMTIEDPVEYQLPLINQVQINLKKELSFAGALRAFLRQDPDIIMIGEIRDAETASIAAEAALTGHLVFSTLHTNDSPGSITRLTDMGVEPFLLAPSLLGIVAQRLVRKICPACKKSYKPSGAELTAVELSPTLENVRFYKGTGCTECKNTGYSGRAAIHEILVVDEEIRELITRKASADMLRQNAAKKGFRPMIFDGLKKAVAGLTTTSELLRVTRSAG
jgi:type IV pilus assembly protein PilB